MSGFSGTVWGFLGRDPEMKNSRNGTSFASFSVAVNTNFNDQQSTTWVSCMMFGKGGETICQNFKKGDGIIVVGDVSVDVFQANDGSIKPSVNMFCKSFGWPPVPREGNGNGNGGNQYQAQQQGGYQQQAQGGYQAQPQQQQGGYQQQTQQAAHNPNTVQGGQFQPAGNGQFLNQGQQQPAQQQPQQQPQGGYPQGQF